MRTEAVLWSAAHIRLGIDTWLGHATRHFDRLPSCRHVDLRLHLPLLHQDIATNASSYDRTEDASRRRSYPGDEVPDALFA